MNDERESTSLSGQPAVPGSALDRTHEFDVGGMDCPSCADDIARSLRKLEGIQDIDVDVMGGKVRVRYAESKLSRGDISGAIRRIGFKVEDGEMKRASFIVEGMDCADEVRQIEDKLGNRPGITSRFHTVLGRAR